MEKSMSKERLISFTDAVIAIIITILVLELKKPSNMSVEAFWELRENFFAYALSFFWLGTMWIILHVIWDPVEKIDTQVIWITLVMLFFSSLFPYATSIVASNFNSALAQVFYGLVVIAITLLNMASYRVLSNADKNNIALLNRLLMFRRLHAVDLSIKFVGLVVCITLWPPAMSVAVLLTLLIIVPKQLRRKDVTA
jgi:uncharacterized membrane protein